MNAKQTAIYIHADRSQYTKRKSGFAFERYIKEGDILDVCKYPALQNSIHLLADMFNPAFVEHIKDMFKSGISYHGYNYLCSVINDNVNAWLEWAIEIYFEYIRFKEFESLPSRFTSVFGKRWDPWGNLQDALNFAPESNIYEITNHTGYFTADMNLLTLDFDRERKIENARRYWQGLPKETNLTYKPAWEYIINTPVKILRRLK